MRILHVITSLLTGGAETLVVNLVPRFQSLGHQVDVVVFDGEHTALMERLEKECPQCRIYKLGNSFYNPWYVFKLIWIMRKYDIVHTHNSSPQLFVALANIFCHKNLVTTEHNTYNRKRGNLFLTWLDKWMYSKYKKVICISDQAEENLRNHIKDNTEESQIITIYNGVDVNSVFSATPIAEMKSDKFVVVMVAAFRLQKDQKTLVEAMAMLPKDQYVAWLVGDGDYLDHMKEYVRSHHANDYVKFLGMRTDVPNILKTADVIVMSTHYEGLSLSNIEGMAAGKPFVATDVDGIREVTKGYGVLVPHEDAHSLANVIKQLHDDKQYYKQVADKCYERAVQFDISEMARKYNEVYLKLSKL